MNPPCMCKAQGAHRKMSVIVLNESMRLLAETLAQFSSTAHRVPLDLLGATLLQRKVAERVSVTCGGAVIR